MEHVVLALDAEESFAAIGPISAPEAAEQIRKQLADRGWSYLGVAPLIAAAEFRQQSEEAAM
jgi:hypothetical protein